MTDARALATGDWRRLARFAIDAAHGPDDAEEALTEVRASLAGLVGARETFAVLATRGPSIAGDPLDGWRPREALLPDWHRRLIGRWEEDQRHVAGNATVVRLMRGAGRVRAVTERELAGGEFERTPTAELLRVLEVADRLLGCCPVAPGVELILGLDRARSDRRFGARERTLALEAMPAVRAVARRFAVGRGHLAPEVHLSPRERDTLRALLTSRSERQIADHLGLTERSLHQYVVAVYRKLGVHGRLELLVRARGARGDEANHDERRPEGRSPRRATSPNERS